LTFKPLLSGFLAIFKTLSGTVSAHSQVAFAMKYYLIFYFILASPLAGCLWQSQQNAKFIAENYKKHTERMESGRRLSGWRWAVGAWKMC